jgi:hypothetical protein
VFVNSVYWIAHRKNVAAGAVIIMEVHLPLKAEVEEIRRRCL